MFLPITGFGTDFLSSLLLHVELCFITYSAFSRLLFATYNCLNKDVKMKENYTQLYPNEQVATAVGNYAFEHSTKLPKHITDHHAWGVASQEKSNYMISPLQAQFLVWMAKAVGAKRSMF
jgi:hypothetical protein